MTTLALTSVGAGTIGDGPGQAVDLIESPPRVGSCRPSTSTLSGPTTSFPTATLRVSNRSTTTANDALVFEVIVDGQKRLLWIPLDLKPQSAVTIEVEYLRELESSGISLCGDRPTGIVEDTQPVATVVVDEEPAGF